MFCYSENYENCKKGCNSCEIITNLNNLTLNFKTFTNEEEIEMTREMLCLVTSWEEPPYFIITRRYNRGICNAFDGKPLENTRIIKYAYLPEYVI